MYAIAFFSTVFVFAATLFIYDALRNYKSHTAKSDLDITPDHHIGTYRKSAWCPRSSASHPYLDNPLSWSNPREPKGSRGLLVIKSWESVEINKQNSCPFAKIRVQEPEKWIDDSVWRDKSGRGSSIVSRYMPPVAMSGRKSRKISCTPHINALSLQCENKITTLSACPSSFLGGHALFKTLDHHFLSIEDIYALILLSHTEHRFFCVSVIAGKKTGNLTKLTIGWQLMSDNYAAIRNVVV